MVISSKEFQPVLADVINFIEDKDSRTSMSAVSKSKNKIKWLHMKTISACMKFFDYCEKTI